MSPAMVEITPSPTSHHLKPHHTQSPNPSKDHQVFTSPSVYLFDQTGIQSINSMDPKNFPPSGKPSAAPGLSKPRLVKVRKHLASPRVRPAPVPDAGPGLGFNPFRSGVPVSDTPVPEAPDRTDDVRDRLYTWKPFIPEAEASQNSGNVGESFMFGTNPKLGDYDAGGFMFGSSGRRSSNLSRTSSDNSMDRLPDDMSKLNLQGASNEASNVDEGVFMFSGGVRGGSNLSGSNLSRSSSLGSGEGLFSMLPDEMRKLKLSSDGNEVFGKMNRAENNSFVFGGSKNMPNEGTQNPDPSDMKSSSNLRQNLARNGGLFSQLPNEMMKLNLQSEVKEDSYHDTKNNNFIFGDSQNAANSYGSSGSDTLPDEIEKLNIGRETSTKNKHDESSDFAASVFVSRSNSRTSSISTQTPTKTFASFEKSTSSNLLGDIKKLDAQGSRNDFVSMNTRESDFGHKIRSESLASSSTLSEPTPFKFSFQAGKQDQNPSISPLPQSQTHETIRPSSVVTPSPYPSSTGDSIGTGFSLRSMREGLETSQMEFTTQKLDSFRFRDEGLSTDLHQNMAFSMRGEAKGTQTRKRRGKSRPNLRENFTPENPELEPAGDYSPMDYSPYQEILAADQCPRESSVASDESIPHASRCSSTDSHISASMDGRDENVWVSMDGREEDLVSAAQSMSINDGDLNKGELDKDGSKDRAERNFTANIFASAEAETDTFISNNESESGEGGRFFSFASSLEDHGKSNLSFTASSSKQGPLPAPKHSHRRKSRMRGGQDSYNSMANDNVPLASPSPNRFPDTSAFVHSDSRQVISSIPSFLKTGSQNRTERSKKPEATHESITTAAASVVAQEDCEKWRLRGNQAYANGYLSKAEEYYTQGVNSVSLYETSGNCTRALMLCHSNRAATRMSLGRMREATIDCKRALAIDPNFLRARVRAANCHLALGEVEDALKHFKKCLQLENGVNCDQKILLEASEGLKKAQQVVDCMDQSVELLLKRTKNDATKALQIISECLLISPYSESLMEMKAEALFMMRSFEEVIQMCEQTIDSAEKNSVIICDNEQLKDVDSSENAKISPESLWRWRLISKSYFYLGKFEEALELLQKHEKVKPIADKFGNKSKESSRSLSVTIRELLRLKAAGNEAFQAGKHLEAIEHYTSALAYNTESRSFTAVCFCNRAAAYQAIGQMTDAIADCSLAIALDSSYPKAISRRATLHEMIRDYGQAANDLNRLVSLLEKQPEDKDNISGKPISSAISFSDLKRVRVRLLTVEEEARKGISLDMYMILGIEPTSSAADVKKAYRKAALRHHPDKAGHFLTRSENVNEGLWREVADEVHVDADRLFKMIGEAYAVLSDSGKRLQYDEEEETRANIKKGYSGSSVTPKAPSDSYGSPQYDRGFNRRRWPAYGWSGSSRSNR